MQNDTSVKVAVRIRPLSTTESSIDDILSINVVPGENQIIAGSDLYFTFDHAFGVDNSQSFIFDECVNDLLSSAFEGFNATIIAYGQTGSGKTYTMGSSADMRMTSESMGIIPRVIQILFDTILEKELNDSRSSYKVQVQFLELYGEEIRDLLDKTRTSKVTIRETSNGEVFISGAREETVSSTAQMMKTLEEGTRHRTTASTGMNNESSRSHAIFTIILEHTIQSSTISEDVFAYDNFAIDTADTPRKSRASIGISHAAAEVRRSKFHFVDLAGSERIKRTKAQGVQMKEGIDINKGLLALGNVISALGDEQKRGKVHVPYRDSKLTRILQDSLGGNSKTLFICCVSPSTSNFHESVNALRYANRARNIKNKPVVNRDPTLLVIDELKELVQNLAGDLLRARRKKETCIDDDYCRYSMEHLEELANLQRPSGMANNQFAKPLQQCASFGSQEQHASSLCATGNSTSVSSTPWRDGKTSSTVISNDEYNQVKSKVFESDFEIRRQAEQIKTLRLESSDLSERLLLAESERDFYKIKWSHSNPDESRQFDNLTNDENADSCSSNDESIKEKNEFVETLSKFKQENQFLKAQLSSLRQNAKLRETDQFAALDESLENELTTSVARVIAQTKEQLLQEAKRLERVAEECGLPQPVKPLNAHSRSSDEYRGSDSDNDCELKASAESYANAEEESFQQRQRLLSTQLQELGDSIVLKENLVIQLKKSQEQYSLMKAFYENKLSALLKEVDEKKLEREQLLVEIEKFCDLKTHTAAQVEQEKKLRTDLQNKDNELRQLKMKQDELSNLSQVQSRYMQQLKKMEFDIESMKKQKVDLTKMLQSEKKRHLVVLHEKVKEVEKLKRELLKTTGEIKKLSQEKLRAEDRAKEAIREGAALRKRKNDLITKTELNSNRISSKSIVKIASLKNAVPVSRFLTQDELKTKKWILSCVARLNDRQAAIDNLRRQCDQQTSLLVKRDELEAQRAIIAADVSTYHQQLDREEALLDVDDKLQSVNQQLKLRTSSILKAQATLEQGEDISEIYDKTLEAMKRSISINLLRLLFEMVVKSQQTTNLYKDLLDKSQANEKSIKIELSNEHEKLSSVRRQYENELVQLKQEYEEKLQGLFENSSVSRILQAESSYFQAPENFDGPIEQLTKDAHSADSYKMVIAILTDKCNNYVNNIQHLVDQSDTLNRQMLELSMTLKHSQAKLEESESMVRFLESERQLYNDMVNELKAAISAFGGTTGQLIVNQIRDNAREKEKLGAARNPQSVLQSIKQLSDHTDAEGPDDDSESVMTEFNEIAEEIARTGTLGLSRQRGVVYDRLTNPLNFTGSMKNVFEKDLASKRQKVQKIKNQSQPHTGSRSLSFLLDSVTEDSIKTLTQTSNNHIKRTNGSVGDDAADQQGIRTSLSKTSSVDSCEETKKSLVGKNMNSLDDGCKENEPFQNESIYTTMAGFSSGDSATRHSRKDSEGNESVFIETFEEVTVESTGSPTQLQTRRHSSVEKAISVTDRLHSVSTQSTRSKVTVNTGSQQIYLRKANV